MSAPDVNLVQIETADADEQAASLPLWHRTFNQLTPGRFAGKLIEVQLGGIQIFREITHQVVHQTGGAWKGSRTFSVPLTMDGNAFYRGEIIDRVALLTLGGDQELSFRTPQSLDIVSVSIDVEALADYASNREKRDIRSELGRFRVIPIGTEAARDLAQFLVTVLDSIVATPKLLRYSALQQALSRSVLSILVSKMRNADDSEPVHKPPTEDGACSMTRCRVVKRAAEYMEAHLQHPITISDICSLLSVSPRTLEYSFKEVMGVKPVSYLRAMRLNNARRELKRGHTENLTVADIAAHWGFWHLPHFASDYRNMFGELPSETLHRNNTAYRADVSQPARQD
jgi:AraC family transcriptional regulator, ethanolamine operon transcriptional activator